MAGRTNVVFGLICLVLSTALGAYFVLKGGAQPEGRSIVPVFVYGYVDSGVNILVGGLLARLPLVGWLSRSISGAAIAGALLHSGVMCLGYLAGTAAPASLVFPGLAVMAASVASICVGLVGVRLVRFRSTV